MLPFFAFSPICQRNTIKTSSDLLKWRLSLGENKRSGNTKEGIKYSLWAVELHLKRCVSKSVRGNDRINYISDLKCNIIIVLFRVTSLSYKLIRMISFGWKWTFRRFNIRRRNLPVSPLQKHNVYGNKKVNTLKWNTCGKW